MSDDPVHARVEGRSPADMLPAHMADDSDIMWTAVVVLAEGVEPETGDTIRVVDFDDWAGVATHIGLLRIGARVSDRFEQKAAIDIVEIDDEGNEPEEDSTL